jgi:hypothetical protein
LVVVVGAIGAVGAVVGAVTGVGAVVLAVVALGVLATVLLDALELVPVPVLEVLPRPVSGCCAVSSPMSTGASSPFTGIGSNDTSAGGLGGAT